MTLNAEQMEKAKANVCAVVCPCICDMCVIFRAGCNPPREEHVAQAEGHDDPKGPANDVVDEPTAERAFIDAARTLIKDHGLDDVDLDGLIEQAFQETHEAAHCARCQGAHTSTRLIDDLGRITEWTDEGMLCRADNCSELAGFGTGGLCDHCTKGPTT